MRESFESYLTAGPIQKLWALMLLSQHYYYIKDYTTAYQFVE